MNRSTPSLLLLSVALVISGCKTASPPQPNQTSRSRSDSGDEGEYNRGYQAESHRHRHHGKHDESSNDNWTGYDRMDTPEGPSGTDNRDALGSRQNYSQGDGGSALQSSRHHNGRASAAPGQFDFYVLNLSWSPEFCHGHPSAVECGQRRAFTLHGLWPQNNDGTYPEDCSEAPGPTNASQYAAIYPDPALLQHEWQTHGTCSGLAPNRFFDLARQAEQAIHVPVELSNLTHATMLTPLQITTLFMQSNPEIPVSSVAITCGSNYLTAVEFCLDKNLKFESCQAIKTCRANQIRIPSPQ